MTDTLTDCQSSRENDRYVDRQITNQRHRQTDRQIDRRPTTQLVRQRDNEKVKQPKTLHGQTANQTDSQLAR